MTFLFEGWIFRLIQAFADWIGVGRAGLRFSRYWIMHID